MKKIVLLIGLITLSQTSAMPVLSPAEPAILTKSTLLGCNDYYFGLRVGYRGDFIYNRKLTNDTGIVSRNFHFYANEAIITLNFLDRVDLFFFTGPSNYGENSVKHDNQNFPADAGFIAESGLKGMWGVGIKAVMWEGNIATYGRSFVAIDAQYEHMSHNNFERIAEEGRFITSNGVGSNFKEVQFSLALGHQIYNFVPYLAIKWSRCRVQPTTSRIVGSSNTPGSSTTIYSLKSRRNVGWAFGLSYIDVNRMSVTAEGRFVDETALTVCAEFKF